MKIASLTQHQAPVSSQSKRLRRSVEPRRGAGRRDLGTRVRHYHRTPFAHKTSAIAAPFKKFPPPQTTKTSPTGPRRHKKARQIFARVTAGSCGGSSGRVREAWRERGPPPKGGPLSLQGLSHSCVIIAKKLHNCREKMEEMWGGILLTSEEKHGIINPVISPEVR